MPLSIVFDGKAFQNGGKPEDLPICATVFFAFGIKAG